MITLFVFFFYKNLDWHIEHKSRLSIYENMN